MLCAYFFRQRLYVLCAYFFEKSLYVLMEPCAYKTMSVMAIFQPLGILREISLSENSLFEDAI